MGDGIADSTVPDAARPGRRSRLPGRPAAARRRRTRSAPFAAALVVAFALPAAAPAFSRTNQAMAEAQSEMLGEATNDNFGWSVGDAGDVNGDGYPDLIVGAIYNDTAAKDAGKAYVFLGGPTVSTVPFVTMTGLKANDQFGVSVAGAGDVNGDGYADVIVGARLNSLNGNAAGAAFIYFGGPAMDGVPDVILLGEAPDDWFGNSVAGAGDVNGDGFDDVLVGAPYNDRGGSAAGAAYVFFGGTTPDNVPDAILVGEMHDDQFGWSVAGAGDADGDGRSDVVVGARLHCVDKTLCTGAAYARGRAYLFLGGWPMSANPALVLDGDAANDWFGNTVAGIGDVNGDGYDDFAVGAIYADPVVGGTVLSAAGTASIYFGGSPPEGARDGLLSGEQPNDQFGWAMARGGDAAGDGRDDFWITAHFYNDGSNSSAGKAYLFPGMRGGPAVPFATMVGEANDVQLGQSVAGGTFLGAGGPSAGLVGEVYGPDSSLANGKVFVLSPFCVHLALDATAISWTTCAPFDAFDLYRGSVLADLRSGSEGGCAQAGLTGSAAALDTDVPASGDSFFYLLTGLTPLTQGALGFDSSGNLRRNTASCP